MNPLPIQVNGLPGRMARAVDEAALGRPKEFTLEPISFCGPEIQGASIEMGGREIRLIRPENRDEVNATAAFAVALDFTAPAAVRDNVEVYCRAGQPFVLGTTGGDYDEVRRQVAHSEVCAVAAPNMAPPILLLQAAFEYLADQFPAALSGWSVKIVESHQAGKIDTSGTAKKMVEYLKALGISIEGDDIEKIRDPQIQRTRLKIPEHLLSGHAYHTYRLSAPDGTVELGLIHNVLGRAVYAEGALIAARFVAKRFEEGVRGHTYSMLDVLRAKGENHE